jgi:hypothetical protein
MCDSKKASRPGVLTPGFFLPPDWPKAKARYSLPEQRKGETSMKPLHTCAFAALLTAVCLPCATAADGGVWRCGNVYTDQPCKNGKQVEIDDARDAGQKRAADESARDAQASARRMEADRLRLETAGARNRPALIDNAPKQNAGQPAAHAKKTRKGQKETLYADPNSQPKKKSKKKAGE